MNTPASLRLNALSTVLALIATIAVAGHSMQAETNTFQAGTSWNTADNWILAHIPEATDALLFDTFVPATTTLDAAFTADTLSFNTASTMAIDANASGTTARTLTLNNTTTNANGTSDIISLLGGGTINLGVTGGKGTTTVALVNAANNINVADGGSLVFGTNSIITGASKALSFTGNSTGMLTLSGANTFNGGFTLTSGIVRATNNTAALGAGTLTLAGGDLQLANGSGLNFARATTVTGNTQITSDVLTSGSAGVNHTLSTLSIGAQTLTVAGGSNVTSGTAGVTFNGVTTLTGNSTFNVTNPVGGGTTALTFSNAITGGANTFTKSGNGTVIFSGTANTYTGLTTVSGGELHLNKTAATNAIAGDVTVGTGTLKLLASNQIANTSNVTVTAGGTFSLNALADTIGNLTISSAGATATIDLGNQTGSTALIIGSNLTLGDNTALIGGGTLRKTGGNLTLNLDGGQISGGNINVGISDAATVINFTKGAGSGGTLTLGSSGATTTSTVNLNQTGSIDVGTVMVVQSNGSGSVNNAVNVNVANTATGMSGGTITTATQTNIGNPAGPNRLFNNANNSLTFASGGSGFTLSGGVLDIRTVSTNAAHGSITTNGNNLTISGGALMGNRLASTSGAITLSGGLLVLRDIRNAAATHFTISTTDGSDGRTIKMLSGNTGTFSVANLATSTNRIIIDAQSDGGTWDRGTLNAGQNYTITADSAGASAFGSAFATYSVAANSGLNGLVMGATAIPTQLTLGANSSFFVATSTAAARTYDVGVAGGGNDVIVAASGSFGFGIANQTNNAANAQVINLNRDKGNADIILLANGAHANNAINIATNQTGSGDLYIAARQFTLNAGTTFGGTGGIYTDLVSGDGAAQSILGGGQVTVTNSGAVPIVFNINGTIDGTNTVNLNQDNQSGSFVIGSTAVIGGTQTWVHASGGGGMFSPVNFSNAMTSGADWTSGSVSFTTRGSQGTFEASTSTVSPSTSSNYKFVSLSLAPVGSAPNGGYKLLNAVQNDGGSAKEAFYAGTLGFSGGITDSSNGHYLFSLNGQDLYVDRFNGITGLSGKGLSFQNDALNTTSEIRALSVTGDTLVGGSFQVLNGATLQFNGGNVNNLIFNRNTGGASGTLLVADSAAAPNVGAVSGSDQKKTLFHNNTTTDIGTFTSFLGSGTDKGTNTSTTLTGTDGTLRVIGGNYSSSGYILNPVGTTGLIDTTDGVTDTSFNDVLIRGNTASDFGGAGVASAFPALIVAGTTTINGNLVIGNATGAVNQATLRVGGDSAVSYSTVTGPSTHSGTGTLIVAGDLTTESAVNVSVQSNGNVKAGGNVSIAGVGTNVSFATNPITGKDGVGIHADSHFTLNGNQGASTPQTIAITPTVGNFHVGDGSAGALTGTAAQARLSANLTSASGVDINGPTSSLNLGGFTLTANGTGLTVGGVLAGNGTVVGATTVISGGTLSPGNSPGTLTFDDTLTWVDGGHYNWQVVDATGLAGTGFDTVVITSGGLDLTGLTTGGFTINLWSLASIGPDVDGDATNFDNSINQSWTLVSGTGDLTGIVGSIFNVNVAVNNGTAGFSNDLGGGSFSVVGTTNSLDLVFIAGSVIPEPSTYAALAAFAALGFAAIRRRRQS